MHGWKDCQTFSRPVVLKGWALDLFPSPGNMLEMMGLQPGTRNSGRSPATWILISPPGTAAAGLRLKPLL